MRHQCVNSKLARGKIDVSEFDRFSESYQQLHNANVRITGETGEYFAAYKANYIAAKVATRPGCRILDYGCGVGLVCRQLKKYLPEARVDGYDVSQVSVNRISSTLRAQGTFTCEARDLGHAYDIVFLANVLHHIEPNDRQDAISHAAELLGRRGKLVIFEHNPANPVTRWAVERCPFDENAVLLPPRESASYLARSGFRRVRLDYIVFFPRVFKWLRRLESVLGWCPLGAQYALVGSET
jgi:2-polyprenyl-3-methyl-5-hydroxy-6-metoxy-1,4-benzoquinol methylase